MVRVITQEIEIEESLKKKIEFICSFCNTTPVIENGSLRTIERTNLAYVEPHRIIIKGINFLEDNNKWNKFYKGVKEFRDFLPI